MHDPKRRIVLTGLGVVSPIGIGKKAFRDALLRGESGTKRISVFEASTYPTQVAGQICGFDPADFIPHKEARRMDRSSHLILASSLMALEDSKLDLNNEDCSRIGVFTGTAVGGQGWAFREYEVFKEKGIRRINPFTAISTFPNASSAQISAKLALKGPSDTISSGCVSSTVALGYAVDYIRSGKIDIAFAGGTDAPLEPGIFGAYCAARVMTTEAQCPRNVPRPFDLGRDGIVISEGAAVLVCESLEHAVDRGARVYAEVMGWSHNADPYSMMMLNPNGMQAEAVMRQAIADAGIGVHDVDYIQAHAAGTIEDDKTEARALRSTFGDCIDKIPVVSVKSMLGHTQGACGAVEGVAAALATHCGVVPPSINCDRIDPECSVNVNVGAAIRKPIGHMLMNTFGFGGKNASVVFGALT